jgi:type II secretory pathway predicted ATPase ExeA
MLSGVMEYFGFRTSLKPVTYYESEYHQQLLKELKAAIHGGGLVAFTGIVGSGKTVLLARLQQQLRDEGQIEVCESLAFEVSKVTPTTLKLALYYDRLRSARRPLSATQNNRRNPQTPISSGS